jgi:hypothetical protein
MAGVREEIYRGSGQVSGAAALPEASPAAFGAGIGAEIEHAGGVLHEGELRALRAEKQRREDAANSQAGVDYATLTQDIESDRASLREQAEPDAAGHLEAVRNSAEARTQAFLGSIADPRVRERWAPQAAELRARVLVDEDGWSRGRRVEAIGNNVKEAGRLWDNQLQTSPEPQAFAESLKAVDTTIGGLNIPKDVAEKLAREEKASRASNFLEGLIEKDPAAAKVAIASGSLDQWLDPKDKRRLLDASDSEIRVAAADMRRQQAQAEAQVREDIGEFKQRVDRGELPSDEETKKLAARAQALGLPNLVDDVQYTTGKLKLSRETDKWTLADWAHHVEPLAAKVAGGHASSEEQMTLRVLQELRPAKEARFRSNPDQAASAAGIDVPQVDLANPQPGAIAGRKGWARAFARTAGLLEPPYLTPDQVKVYRDRASQGPVGQLEVASEIRRSWGDAAPSIVRSIGGEAKADMMVMLGLPDATAQHYTRGVEALQKKLVKFNDDAARSVWRDYAAAVPPDLRGAVFDAARNIAAGWMAEKGFTDPPENFGDVFRQAIHRAGGMLGSAGEGSATGGFINYNGRLAWLPSDMSRSDFQKRLARAGPGAWQGAAVDAQGNPTGAVPHHLGPNGKPAPYSPQELRRFGSGTVQTVAPGVYRLLDPLGHTVVDEHGRPWTFDVRRLR